MIEVMKNITLTQLSYIVAVAKFRNFGQAAESCFVTQPTLSMQIQKLENQLEVEIFDRSQNPVGLTTIGAAIIEQARIILSEARKLEGLVEQNSDEIQGHLRLAVIPTLAATLLPRFIRRFSQKYPKVSVAIEELQTHVIIDRLKEESLDVGLLVTPLGQPQLIEHELFQEPFMVYCSPGHPYLNQSSISEKQLSAKDVWLLSEGHCFREQVISLCARGSRPQLGSDHTLSFESGNLETLRKMVDLGEGYTLLPWLLVNDMTEAERKTRVRGFSGIAPSRQVSLVHHRAYARKKMIEALTEAVHDGLPKDLLQKRSLKMKPIPLKTGL